MLAKGTTALLAFDVGALARPAARHDTRWDLVLMSIDASCRRTSLRRTGRAAARQQPAEVRGRRRRPHRQLRLRLHDAGDEDACDDCADLDIRN